MERMQISNLRPGTVFAQELFTASGEKLLNANVPLDQRHIDMIRRGGDLDVLLAGGVEELVAAGVLHRLDSSKLTVGQRIRHSVLNPAGQVLVEADQEIEPHHLDALAAGGRAFEEVKDTADKRRERILLGDALVEDLEAEARMLDLRVGVSAITDWFQPEPPADWPAPAQLAKVRDEAVERVRHCFARIEAGVSIPVDTFDPLLDDLLDRLSRHPTRFTQLALLSPGREDYLPDHAYTAAVLVMAVAAQLRWPRHDVRQVGLAGLVCDVGMLQVPERIRIGAGQLNNADRSHVQRHPVFTLAMLQALDQTPAIVKLAALQHHERENGTGYPRGKRRDSICDYARVLAVADSFAAATEPRHYRPQKLPFLAMEETLRAASLMVLWKPAARALVQAAGLFPVGSYLKLSDGRSARVLAANPAHPDRPTVQTLDAAGRPDGESLDLAAAASELLAIVRPLPALPALAA
jgi:HD-GYP domain-containing protein (c-di-GMP phosphodiesterase class II)